LCGPKISNELAGRFFVMVPVLVLTFLPVLSLSPVVEYFLMTN
jgi:K+-transporting ATPase A subunit